MRSPRLSVVTPSRWVTRMLALVAIAVGIVVPVGLTGSEAGAASGTAAAAGPRRSPPAFPVGQIIYPDLVSVIPATDLAISQPTATTREFNYEHIMYNAGGPLEVQPVNYNPTHQPGRRRAAACTPTTAPAT